MCKYETSEKAGEFPFSPPVKHVKKDERKYYEELLRYSRDHLMLYPYHLSDIMVKGLRITPFSYYTGIMEVSVRGAWTFRVGMGLDFVSGTLCRWWPATVDIVSELTVSKGWLATS